MQTYFEAMSNKLFLRLSIRNALYVGSPSLVGRRGPQVQGLNDTCKRSGCIMITVDNEHNNVNSNTMYTYNINNTRHRWLLLNHNIEAVTWISAVFAEAHKYKAFQSTHDVLVCVYICVGICIHIYLSLSLSIYIYIYISIIYLSIYLSLYTYIYISIINVCVYIYI